MTDQKQLKDVFQKMLKDLRNNTEICAVLDQISKALGDVQQALAQESMAFGFSFGHYETISPTLGSQLSGTSGKNLERSVSGQCAINYHIDGQDYFLALARFSDNHYRTKMEYIGSHSYESRSWEKDEHYDVIVSPNEKFRFDTDNQENPLEELKNYLVEQAAKQKFLQGYGVKKQPRRILRTKSQP